MQCLYVALTHRSSQLPLASHGTTPALDMIGSQSLTASTPSLASHM